MTFTTGFQNIENTPLKTQAMKGAALLNQICKLRSKILDMSVQHSPVQNL